MVCFDKDVDEILPKKDSAKIGSMNRVTLQEIEIQINSLNVVHAFFYKHQQNFSEPRCCLGFCQFQPKVLLKRCLHESGDDQEI